MKRIWIIVLSLLTMLCGVGALAASAPAASASGWAWSSSAAEGTWNLPNYWVVQNDAWSGGHGPQTIYANNYHDWQAVSNQPAGNTAVETYPDSQRNFGPAGGNFPNDPITIYTELYSTFKITMPTGSGISAEAAYDVWWGNGWSNLTEMMIWVNTVNRSLAGGTHLGVANIGHQVFNVWRYGSSEYIFVLNHNETSGGVHILASGQWLVNHGYMAKGKGLTAIPFGFEICSTGGVNKTFTVNDLTLAIHWHR